MNDKPDISVVLPIYNQADHVEGIVQQYLASLGNLKHSCELILVVNGNEDGSLERCQDLAQSYDLLKVLYDDQSGWGRAVRKGLEAATGDILMLHQFRSNIIVSFGVARDACPGKSRINHKGQPKTTTSICTAHRIGNL